MAASTSLNPSSKTYVVEKLNTTNYNSWSVKMELVLILNDYFRIVDGSEPNPGTANSANFANQLTWKQKDSKARAIILSHCGEKQFSAVKRLATSKAVWDKLKETYQQIDLAIQVTAQKKLSQLHITEDTPILEFIEEFQSIIDEILVSGLTIPEDQQYVHLLRALRLHGGHLYPHKVHYKIKLLLI
jgi:hypothetical protein